MNINKISNYIMNIGIALSLYGAYKIYDSRKGLLEGTCPISNYDLLLYTAITILLISLILSFIGDAKDKKAFKE